MADLAYEAVVQETFETKPLRTVLMIDDEFPTFVDLADGENEENKNKFAQKPLALALYKGFKQCHMICDIENTILGDESERFRKSDLIILDFHLGPVANDSEKSIRLLRDLAGSKHFNTVVVYTLEPKLDEVWLDIIASISGGWAKQPASLIGPAQAEWERLADENRLPEISKEAVMQFIARSRLEDLTDAAKKPILTELHESGVPAEVQESILEALLYRELAKLAGPYAALERQNAVGSISNGVRWIQSQNAFVAILQKKTLPSDGAGIGDEKDPVGIMEGLRKALLAWQPNLLQILVSEVQNVLELEALATSNGQLQKPETQTALWYYLLQSLGKIDLENPTDVTAPIIAILDKILDGVRQKLVTDSGLLKLASDALIGSLKETNWNYDNWPQPSIQMFEGATSLARTKGLVQTEDVIFRLNSFFSTEDFSRAHLTTGTIFCNAAADTFWVAASPACDLEDRKPGAYQTWAHSIDPITAVIALRLQPYDNVNKALKESTNGRYVFLETAVGEKKVFKLVDDGGSPSYEFFFAQSRGRVISNGAKKVFKAGRLAAVDGTPEGAIVTEEFEIVHQLRGLNASRTLHVAGQHLSRIGLDFIAMPKQ